MPSDVAVLREELRTARAELLGLREAMTRRAVIEQAKGVFMERYGVDDEAAFARLVALSQSTNVKLVQIAADVVSHAGLARTEQDGVGWIERALDAFGDPALVLSPVPTERGLVADFQVDHANKAASSWTGRPRDRLIGSATAALYQEADANLLRSACRRALTTGGTIATRWPTDEAEGNGRVRLHTARIGTVVLATWQRASEPVSL